MAVYPGCRFACPGLRRSLGFQPAWDVRAMRYHLLFSPLSQFRYSSEPCGTGMFSHRSQIPCGVLLSKNTDITDAHGWVFSRILYSCSAAHCLVLMRSRRNGSTRIFSQAESCVGECHTMGLLGMRKICGNPRDLWATTKRAMR